MIITAILAGLIMGPLMAWLFNRRSQMLWNIPYAIVGALIFRIFGYFTFYTQMHDGFSAAGIVAALLGAAIFTFVPKLHFMKGSQTEEDEDSEEDENLHFSEGDAEAEAELEEKEEEKEIAEPSVE